MLRRALKNIVLLASAAALTASCGLLPDLSGEKMSSAEKAKLNMQMGVRYLDLGILDVAQEKLEEAASLDSSNPEIHNALAVFYERIKNFDEAIDHYQSALNKDSDNISTKNNYGRLLCERGEYEKGMGLLQQALDAPMNTRTWLALTNMGSCLIKQKDFVRGEAYFRQALQANGEYAPALQEMQKISYNNGQYMSARAFLERYLSVAKHTPETLWYAFQTERALGNSQATDDYKQQLLNSFPASKEALEVKTAINK